MTKPRSSEAVEGDTVIILCEVVGDPKPEVMWLRDWLRVSTFLPARLRLYLRLSAFNRCGEIDIA